VTECPSLVPDLLITLTCFTDIMGNRMDLYDTVVWFDDWMHFSTPGCSLWRSSS
jgi:hypothetical protein